jgi:hypothetical protein
MPVPKSGYPDKISCRRQVNNSLQFRRNIHVAFRVGKGGVGIPANPESVSRKSFFEIPQQVQ